MGKKVIIELNEAQAYTVLAAVEEWFRLRMGQSRDLADGLAFLGYTHDRNKPEAFNRRIQTRDNIEEVFRAVFRIAFGYHGVPERTPPEVHVASDIWSALRWELSSKDGAWDRTPFRMGPEPMPKITVEEVE